VAVVLDIAALRDARWGNSRVGRPVNMSDPLHWGVLSTAHINEKMLAGAALSPDVEVVAIASRDTRRAEAFAARWGIGRAYGKYDDLLSDEAIDAVYVPLPNGLHHLWTLRALRAGKHVLCEKPYSRRPADVEEAFAEADVRGLVLSEGFMYRYHPQIRELARIVRVEGLIGDVRVVVSSFTWPTDEPGDVRLDSSLDGGSLLDVGVYCISAARLLAGEPRTVAAHQVLGPTGVDVYLAATMELDSRALAHFDCGVTLPDRSHLEVVGSKGTLNVSDPWHCLEPGLTLVPQGKPAVRVPMPQANSYQLELEEFGKAVRRETHHLLGRDDALSQARAVDAIFRAATSGRRETVY
jgi:Predicted dehydrogenases and related proteins